MVAVGEDGRSSARELAEGRKSLVHSLSLAARYILMSNWTRSNACPLRAFILIIAYIEVMCKVQRNVGSSSPTKLEKDS